MVKFLINRPIAVIMTFVAFFIFGVVAYFRLPVSLMPDIAIPEITVQASFPNSSANEMENAVSQIIRAKLLQLSNLNDLQCQTRNGSAVVRLKFEYGTDINLAFIETNEKIDAIVNYLPKGMERPKIIKASATDIPVFYLNVSLNNFSEDRFLELSAFCENVLKRHIEQLPRVAMTDMSGQTTPRIIIEPNRPAMNALGLNLNDIKTALTENNVELGNLSVNDGLYQYNVRFSSILRTADDIANIYLRAGDKIVQMRDLARVFLTKAKPRGMFTTGNKPAITLAIIKQANARMDDMKGELNGLIEYFVEKYPDLNFEIAQDQTQLLDYSISNLESSLIVGILLVMVVMLVFLRNPRSSFLVCVTIPVSVIISLLFFMFSGLSVNIISLSGLILAVGMMIDNSIIVIDNINQHYDTHRNLQKAVVDATTEVITPLLSSVLTTCAIFIPMIFLSGISGALFFDQAITVAIGLGASYIVSITLLPTLFYLLFKNHIHKNKPLPRIYNFFDKYLNFEDGYERGFDFVFRHRQVVFISFLMLLPVTFLLFNVVNKEKLPSFEQTELIAKIDWNESVNIDENKKRIEKLFSGIDSLILQKNTMIGEQQFLLDRDNSMTVTEASVYVKASSARNLEVIEKYINSFVIKQFRLAKIEFEPPQNIFESLFSTDEGLLTARIFQKNKNEEMQPSKLIALTDSLDQLLQNRNPNRIPVDEYISIVIDFERLFLYNVSHATLLNTLKTAFNEYEIGQLKSSTRFVPIVLGDSEQLITEILNTLKVENADKEAIPVKALIKTERKPAFKTIIAGKDGRYLPLTIDANNDDCVSAMNVVKAAFSKNSDFDVAFSGSYFSQRILFRELMIVFGVSLLLLYFILAAQFESLVQPLIVLIEVPIDLAGALLMLWLFGSSLNIMSMIGIVVMSGIVINDSILKIDTINHLRTMPNYDLITAIKIGGHRRIRSIIMTSLTTIFALVPFAFGSGMGAELQLPLSLAMIGGMILGTVVSLYFIPLLYWYLYR